MPWLSVALAVLLVASTSLTWAQEYRSGVQWQEPAIVMPAATIGDAPSDAIVLFDGGDLSAWEGGQWKVQQGEMVVGRGRLYTKQHFGDCQLHVEWSSPTPPTGAGQGRGNSGIFFCKFPHAPPTWGYEIQVLNSYQNKTYADGQAGAIYKQTPPMVNAMRPPGDWNSYDLYWTAPRFNEDGSLRAPAYMTAVHNGVLILNHFELQGDTPYQRPPRYTPHPPRGPIALQDHGNPVRFRNIWVREIMPPAGERISEPYLLDDEKKLPVSAAEE